MCVRTQIRTIHGVEVETTQFSGEGYQRTYFTRIQAQEFCARLADEPPNDLPEPQMYTHPTTGAEVLEVWEDYTDSHIFHHSTFQLESEDLYDVTDLSWDD